MNANDDGIVQIGVTDFIEAQADILPNHIRIEYGSILFHVCYLFQLALLTLWMLFQ